MQSIKTSPSIVVEYADDVEATEAGAAAAATVVSEALTANDKIDPSPKKSSENDLTITRREDKRFSWSFLANYSAYSSIYGVHYFGEQPRHWLEKLWWLLSLSSASAVCLWLVISMYINWQQNAVTIGFSHATDHVWDIPFPAVTICPEIKIQNASVLDLTICKEHKNCTYSEELMSNVNAAELVCRMRATDEPVEENVTNIIRQLGPPISDIFELCSFRGVTVDCHTIFFETLTNEGICWTFNMLQNKQMFTKNIDSDFHAMLDHSFSMENYRADDGYTVEADSRLFEYPHRVLRTSEALGSLGLKLKAVASSNTCNDSVSGFKVLVHPNDIYPNMQTNQFKQFGIMTDTTFNIDPKITRAEPKIATYSAEQRQCYYRDERKLHFFAVYNQNNCELECLSRLVERQFQCLPFYMPRNESTPICSGLAMHEIKLMEENFFDGALYFTERKLCRCYPACNVVSYETTAASSRSPFLFGFGSLFSRLIISYKKEEFNTMRRFEWIGRLRLLAAHGGLVGMFMGISMLSIVQLLYLFSLRLCRKNGKEASKSE